MKLLARSLVLLFLLAAPALAEKRVALVIGNAAYKHAPALANPKNDAEGVAAALQRLKFEVLAGTDLDKPAMEKLLQAFSLKLETADVALVFYAGHGLQVHGRNYLVPVEAKLDREADLVFQAVPLDVIQGLMEAHQRTNIMILDACRDNPLARNLARTMGTRSTSIGRGLGETKAGIGTLIVYATQPGNVALDGDTKNSPFTAALLKHIEAPGLEIRQVLTRVRNDVITATRDKQVPWDSSSLRGDFYFAAAPGAMPAAPAPVTPPSVTTPPAVPDNEALFWQTIKDSKNAADFKDYLQRWPSGTLADLAKRRVAEIEKAADVTPPAPEKRVPAPPKRTSTIIAGQTLNELETIPVKAEFHGIASAQACAALCIERPQCTAWMYMPVHNPMASLQLVCRMYQRATPRNRWTDTPPHYYAGFIRTTPTAAPAPPAAPKPERGATPIAPQPGNALARELMRKALAKEKEDGFCAKTGWPRENVGDYPRVSAAKNPAGTTTIQYLTDVNTCNFARFSPSFMEGGRPCRTLMIYSCWIGLTCLVSTKPSKYCEVGPGRWELWGQ